MKSKDICSRNMIIMFDSLDPYTWYKGLYKMFGPGSSYCCFCIYSAVEKERDAAGSKDIKQEGTEKQVSSAVHNPVDKVQVKSEVQSSSSVVVTVSMAEELEAEKGIFISESLRYDTADVCVCGVLL